MSKNSFEEAWVLSQDHPPKVMESCDCHIENIKGDQIVVLLDRNGDDIEEFLSARELVPEELLKPLLQEDTRPRCEKFKNGVLLNLRGINLNPGAQRGDMLSARMWITDHYILVLHAQRLMALKAITERFQMADGPTDIGEFLVDLAEGLTDRMEPEVQQIDEEIDTLEAVLDDRTVHFDHKALLDALAQLRPLITALRRFIAPQQEALSRLAALQVPWLSEIDRINLRHDVDVVTRIVEDLDTLRERASLVKDSIQQRMADAMTQSMNWLSAVAFVFLPLGFLTGLLGINVGGMPGAQISWAFWAVCAIMVVLGIGLWWFMRRRNLL